MRPIKLLSCIPALMIAGLLTISSANAQIKIGTNGAIISPSSLLELESANQGLLLPRMADTAAINALNPPNGMLIYLTKAPAVGLYVRKVTGWEYLTGSLGGNGNFTSLTVSGAVTAGSFSGPLTGNASSATTAATATNSLNVAVINDLNSTATVFPTFATITPGNNGLRTSNTKLSFVPATGILTALGFSGPLTGNVTGTATQAIDATNAANTEITNDFTTNGLHYPTFVSGTSGNLPQKTSSANLTFNPGTGILTATGFSGNLAGNSTTATNVTTTTITDDIAQTTAVYPTFVTNTSGNWGQRTAGSRLSFVPSTGVLTAGGFTSTVLTGTAPFVVTSSTPVANLTSTNAVNTGITDAGTIAGTAYPTFVMGTSGNLPQRIAASSLSFVPSTGRLNATSFAGLWNGTIISGEYGGTGVNNGIRTITLGGDLLTTGSTNSLTLNTTGTTAVTLPTSGTLYGTASGSILSSALMTSLNDETGTGQAVFGTAPSLIRPVASSLLADGVYATTKNATVGTGVQAASNVSGTNLAGTVTIVIVGGAGSDALLTVNYSTPFPAGSYPILFPATATAANLMADKQVYATGTTTSFTINSTGILPDGTYTWNYHVIGR